MSKQDLHTHYKWPTAYAWLREKANKGEIETKDLLFLVSKLDGDAIQDTFENDMDADRYFAEIYNSPCPICREEMEKSDTESQECSRCHDIVHIGCGDTVCGKFFCEDCL